MVKSAPTLLCANSLNVGKDIEIFKKAGISMLHADIMDGHFVPNIALNPDIVRDIKRKHEMTVDVHLMVTNPYDYIERFSEYHADMISFHIEATSTPIRILNKIKSHGMKAGIALNPATPVTTIEYVLNQVDFILLMAVEPGYSGQAFIESTYEKISQLHNLRENRKCNFEIGVDGGIDDKNSIECIKRGADMLVLGALCIYRPDTDLAEETTRMIEMLKKVKK
jgi:ribulose-phosphate 3-epimerase